MPREHFITKNNIHLPRPHPKNVQHIKIMKAKITCNRKLRNSEQEIANNLEVNFPLLSHNSHGCGKVWIKWDSLSASNVPWRSAAASASLVSIRTPARGVKEGTTIFVNISATAWGRIKVKKRQWCKQQRGHGSTPKFKTDLINKIKR